MLSWKKVWKSDKVSKLRKYHLLHRNIDKLANVTLQKLLFIPGQVCSSTLLTVFN